MSSVLVEAPVPTPFCKEEECLFAHHLYLTPDGNFSRHTLAESQEPEKDPGAIYFMRPQCGYNIIRTKSKTGRL
jgi:hypothetical protein